VAGTHRAAKQAITWLWAALAVIWTLLAIGNLGKGHNTVLALVNGVLAVLYVVLAWGTTRAHTLVDAEGVRVSQGIGGRRIGWDAIASVSRPNRWDTQATLAVTTAAQKRIPTHVPMASREDFIAYANTHRSSASRPLD